MGDTDVMRFECPHCANPLRASAKAAGKRVHCPKCSKAVDIPLHSEVEQEAPQPAAQRPTWPWLAGGGAVAALLLGLVIWMVVSSLPEPPFVMEDGKPLPGKMSTMVQLRVRDGTEGSTPAIRVGLKNEKDWEYEIRPKGADALKLKMEQKGDILKGGFSISIRWVDQAYEILDKELKVVFSHPKIEDIGKQRKAVFHDESGAPKAAQP